MLLNTIEDLLAIEFTEEKQTVEAVFRKTVYIRQYETEVYECRAEVTLEGSVDGFERNLIVSILRAQLENSVYTDLYIKKIVTKTEYDNNVQNILVTINSLINQYEKEYGRDIRELLRKVKIEKGAAPTGGVTQG